MLDTDGYIWDLLTAIRTAEENTFSVRDLHTSNGHFTKFKVPLAARAVPAGHNDPHSCDATSFSKFLDYSIRVFPGRETPWPCARMRGRAYVRFRMTAAITSSPVSSEVR